MTVLFCDLVGSTQLAGALDPEGLRELTSAYHTVCEMAIRRHDRYIARYRGDGVLVYFGFPPRTRMTLVAQFAPPSRSLPVWRS